MALSPRQVWARLGLHSGTNPSIEGQLMPVDRVASMKLFPTAAEALSSVWVGSALKSELESRMCRVVDLKDHSRKWH